MLQQIYIEPYSVHGGRKASSPSLRLLETLHITYQITFETLQASMPLASDNRNRCQQAAPQSHQSSSLPSSSDKTEHTLWLATYRAMGVGNRGGARASLATTKTTYTSRFVSFPPYESNQRQEMRKIALYILASVKSRVTSGVNVTSSVLKALYLINYDVKNLKQEEVEQPVSDYRETMLQTASSRHGAESPSPLLQCESASCDTFAEQLNRQIEQIIDQEDHNRG